MGGAPYPMVPPYRYPLKLRFPLGVTSEYVGGARRESRVPPDIKEIPIHEIFRNFIEPR